LVPGKRSHSTSQGKGKSSGKGKGKKKQARLSFAHQSKNKYTSTPSTTDSPPPPPSIGNKKNSRGDKLAHKAQHSPQSEPQQPSQPPQPPQPPQAPQFKAREISVETPLLPIPTDSDDSESYLLEASLEDLLALLVPHLSSADRRLQSATYLLERIRLGKSSVVFVVIPVFSPATGLFSLLVVLTN
jgi:hypothetical protein|tara:strand:- start:2653 stop:3210 length:558 start_codon:yes stop_codon:yes gene_type:complete